MIPEERPDTKAVLDLLGDAASRKILGVLQEDKDMSASDLEDECNLSTPTIYRRLNSLSDLNLVKEELNLNTEGNHYTTYVSNIDSIEIKLHEGRDVKVEENPKHEI
ncbi:MAG: helix-turn-helix domain-containing protein [Halobacteria archaeon]